MFQLILILNSWTSFSWYSLFLLVWTGEFCVRLVLKRPRSCFSKGWIIMWHGSVVWVCVFLKIPTTISPSQLLCSHPIWWKAKLVWANWCQRYPIGFWEGIIHRTFRGKCHNFEEIWYFISFCLRKLQSNYLKLFSLSCRTQLLLFVGCTCFKFGWYIISFIPPFLLLCLVSYRETTSKWN